MEVKSNAHVLIVKPDSTRIDAAFAMQFKTQLLNSFQEGNTTIVLDLSEVDFIDSSGLGALVASKKALADKGEIAICELRERVQSLFKVTRMNKVFQIFDSKEAALKALSSRNA